MCVSFFSWGRKESCRISKGVGILAYMHIGILLNLHISILAYLLIGKLAYWYIGIFTYSQESALMLTYKTNK